MTFYFFHVAFYVICQVPLLIPSAWVDLSQQIISGVSLRSRHGCDSRDKHCVSHSCGSAVEFFFPLLEISQTSFLTFHRFPKIKFNSSPLPGPREFKEHNNGKRKMRPRRFVPVLCSLGSGSYLPYLCFSAHCSHVIPLDDQKILWASFYRIYYNSCFPNLSPE